MSTRRLCDEIIAQPPVSLPTEHPKRMPPVGTRFFFFRHNRMRLPRSVYSERSVLRGMFEAVVRQRVGSASVKGAGLCNEFCTFGPLHEPSVRPILVPAYSH